jgi:acyl-CoA thioester hydrolase
VPTTTAVQIRFSDLDLLGHVSNVAYYDLMESGRASFFRGLRHSLSGRIVIAHSECDHVREIPAGTSHVDVTVALEKTGRTSFALLHELRIGEQVVAIGRTVHVVIGEDDLPRPLTSEERQRLAEA